MTNESSVDQYLTRLRASLSPLRLEEREEILREIRAHIRDSAEEPGGSIDAVLSRLGSPERLAIEYRDGLLIRQASRSLSPLLLLRGALRLAAKGIFGALIFFSGIFGYLIGGGLILSAFLKVFLPDHTGLWMDGHHFVNSGTLFPAPGPPAREVLGYWYIFVALTAGSLLLTATTLAIRLCLRTSQYCQSKLGAAGRKMTVQI